MMQNAEYDAIVDSCRPTPENAARVRQQRIADGQAGYTKRDNCNRCGRYYDELNANCGAAKLHEVYTKERETELRAETVKEGKVAA
jgi:hypothetical protein